MGVVEWGIRWHGVTARSNDMNMVQLNVDNTQIDLYF